MRRDKENESLFRRGSLFPERSQRSSEPLSPFNILRRFSDEMDRMFGDFLTPNIGRIVPNQPQSSSGIRNVDWMPAIEVRERDNNLIVRADLPGLNAEDVKVELQDEGLLIQGETKHEDVQEKEGFYHSERSYGRFSRFIPLPGNVNADQITANFRNGMLEINIPVPEQTKNRKQIQIQTEAKGKEIDIESNKTKETDKKSAKAQ
jgi:HSP20 family protein